MLTNQTQTNEKVHYTKGGAPFTVMAHIFFYFDLFSLGQISSNGPGSFSKILEEKLINLES